MAKYKKTCFVPSCKNTSENSEKVFVTVPREENIREHWCQAVGRVFSKSSAYCCEDHFELKEDAENWLPYSYSYKRIQLKKGVVPHKNLYVTSDDPQTSQLSSSAKKRKRLGYGVSVQTEKVVRQLFDDGSAKKKPKSTIYDDPVPSTSRQTDEVIDVGILHTPGTTTEVEQSVESPTTTIVHKKDTVSSPSGKFKVTEIEKKHVTTQTRLQYYRSVGVTTKSPRLSNMGTSPIKFKSTAVTEAATLSLSSSSLSETVLSTDWTISATATSPDEYEDVSTNVKKQVRRNSTILWVENNSRFYLGIPEDMYHIIKILDSHCLVTYTNILIVLKKIRLFDSNFRLGIDFGLDKSTVGRIFTTNILKIAEYFKSLIFWPQNNLIVRQMPISFRARYKDVQSIIDCLEIEIEKPSSAVQQALTWSDYKKANTIKYLISATPDGIINFISSGFGGRITDKLITENCGFLDVLPPNCGVMADRGFKHIEPLLKKKNCSLIRPPSVPSGARISKEEVKTAKRIASLRIHIERVIRRLREFYMLSPHACVNHKLIWTLDYAIIIACGIINVQGALIKK